VSCELLDWAESTCLEHAQSKADIMIPYVIVLMLKGFIVTSNLFSFSLRYPYHKTSKNC